MTTHTCEHSGITFPVKDGWIKVEDRLPDLDKPVLSLINFSESNEIEICLLDSRNKRWRIKNLTKESKALLWVGLINGSITHWQPLPEPPKE